MSSWLERALAGAREHEPTCWLGPGHVGRCLSRDEVGKIFRGILGRFG